MLRPRSSNINGQDQLPECLRPSSRAPDHILGCRRYQRHSRRVEFWRETGFHAGSFAPAFTFRKVYAPLPLTLFRL